jgi:predicted phage terminase large subunit-like protein
MALSCSAQNHEPWQLTPHLGLIDSKLVDLATRKLRRLVLSVPVRHGKSTVLSWFAAWHLLHWPDRSVIWASYGSTLAERWSVTTRDILANHGRRLAGLEVTGPSEHWHIAGHKGYFRAAGVGQGVTGLGASLIICDDPIKSQQEYDSATIRESTWRWFLSTLLTRLEPDGVLVLCASRWGQDDITGRVLRLMNEEGYSEPWEHVNLAALAEANDPLSRQPGDALWPERYDKAKLQSIETEIGAHAFAALYQGNPVARQGNLFETNKLAKQIVPCAAVHLRRCRAWDCSAGSQRSDGDYTAGVLLARDKDKWIIEDCRHFKLPPAERDRLIVQTAAQDRLRYGEPHEPIIHLDQDPGAAGVSFTQALAAQLVGYRVRTTKVSGSKALRAEPVAAQVGAGNVCLANTASWDVPGFLEELAAFPHGRHDDRVDALSAAFAHLVVAPTTGTVRCYPLRPRDGRQPPTFRLIVAAAEELTDWELDQRRSLVIHVTDPPTPSQQEQLPQLDLPTGIHAIDRLTLQFLDLDPAEIQATWHEPIQPYGKPAAELMFSKEMGKRLWSFLTRTRGAAPERVLFIEEEGRRCLSLALAVADMSSLSRGAIWLPAQPDFKADKSTQPPNPHVFRWVRESKAMVIGELPCHPVPSFRSGRRFSWSA